MPVAFHMSDQPSSEVAPIEEQREPCPTPLESQDIVRSFQEEMRQGPVAFEGGTITATQFGSGPPLIFLPGTLGTPRLYALTAWLLRNDRQCWLLDHPNFDKNPPESELVAKTASAYASVLTELFGGPVDIYASTFTVPICLRMMSSTPNAVKKAALQSGWMEGTLTTAERLLLKIGKRLPVTMRRVPGWVSTQIQNHRPWFPPFDKTRFSFLLGETYQTNVSDASRRMLASTHTDLRDRVKEIPHEILILRTEGDGQYITDQQEWLEKQLPNSQVSWMHTSGHYPYLTHPHRLVKSLREFFEIPKSETV